LVKAHRVRNDKRRESLETLNVEEKEDLTRLAQAIDAALQRLTATGGVFVKLNHRSPKDVALYPRYPKTR